MVVGKIHLKRIQDQVRNPSIHDNLRYRLLWSGWVGCWSILPGRTRTTRTCYCNM